MKHAYLIMVLKETSTLRTLLMSIDSPYNDIYVDSGV